VQLHIAGQDVDHRVVRHHNRVSDDFQAKSWMNEPVVNRPKTIRKG
jgi:hypothetical protein